MQIIHDLVAYNNERQSYIILLKLFQNKIAKRVRNFIVSQTFTARALNFWENKYKLIKMFKSPFRPKRWCVCWDGCCIEVLGEGR